jgi:glycosyltransferase involved in cell wall biosynthesis
VIVHDATGLLAPPGNADALSSALRRMLTDHELRSRLAAGARDLVRREFSAEAMASRYLELYQQMTSAPRSGSAPK